MDSFKQELLKEYLLDAVEHVETIENTVINLEKKLTADEIDLLFRAYHTLKGNSALVGQLEVRDVSHVIESMIGLVRNGEMPVTHKMADIILDSVDIIKRMISEIESNNGKVTINPSDIIKRVSAFKEAPRDQEAEIVPEEGAGQFIAKNEPVKMVVKSTPSLAIFEIPVTLSKNQSDEFIAAIRNFQQRGITGFIFNFINTDSLGNDGIAIIISAVNEIESSGGKLVCCSLSNKVAFDFRGSGFIETLKTAPTLKDAVNQLS